MGRQPGQVMEDKEYKAFVKQFESASDRESKTNLVRHWFDVGGGPAESIGDPNIFSTVLSINDDSLTDHVLATYDRWAPIDRKIATRDAILAGNATVLKKLLDLGVSPKAERGAMPYVAAAADANAFDCVDLLLEHGASLEDRGAFGYTALHWAASSGNETAIQTLLERGADPHAVAKDEGRERTVLEVAQERGHDGVVRLLLAQERGATQEEAEGEQPAHKEVDPDRVRAAIAEVQQIPVKADVWFGEQIPYEELETAIVTFANSAASETPLALIPAASSGKAGFLLTDAALYFRENGGTKNVRIRYGDIKLLTKNHQFLRVSAEWGALEWDLSETAWGEQSRRRSAELVVSILQKLLGEETPPLPVVSGEDKTASAAAPIHVDIEAPVDWPAVIAFHAPAVLLGVPIVMPAIFALAAASGLVGDELSRGLGRLGYVQLLTFGAMSLGPAMFAYGTRLQFSIGRFLVAAAFVAFVSIQALATAMRSGSTLPISFGGGLLGIAVVTMLGGVGLAIYKAFKRPADDER